jgi:multiple antibiotic resistance protein
MLWQDLYREFITLFVVIDPIGSIPVFLYASKNVKPERRGKFALRAVIIATIVLLAFLILGQIILETLGLRLGSFQVAGGIILFLFALDMIFGQSKPDSEIEMAERDDLAGAVFPLAMPSIASPGAILAIVILTDNQQHTVVEQAITAGVLLSILALTFGLLLAATRIQKLIGDTGASVISRIMGLVLATVAIDAIVNGLISLDVVTLFGT